MTATASQHLASQVEEITAGLRQLLAPGAVAELRAIGAARRRKSIASGYFDDPEAMAEAAARIDRRGKGAVYFTVNPVAPALLARACNRVQDDAEPTTADHDVAGRRWLPVDLDPTRPAGIASTDQEHDQAIARAWEVRAWLVERGWPDPVVVDSGNGAYVLARLELPNDAAGLALVERCLQALAVRFDDPAVHVDPTMRNAARILRVPATTNRKGDSTPDRPHRVARILHAPEATEAAATLETVEALAGMAPQPEPSRRPASSDTKDRTQGATRDGTRDGSRGTFDLEAFIARHLGEVTVKDNAGGGKRWVLDVCPFNGDHSRGEAWVLTRASGAIAAGCQHSGCTWGWDELRARFDPKPQPRKRKPESRERGGDTSGTPPALSLPARCDLDTVEKLFLALVDKGDVVALRATLAAYAANLRLDGDPVWLGLIAGSSTGKTETALALRTTPRVLVASTLSGEAALLSGTPTKERAAGATGGLLREAGPGALLVLKDFTSILSMNRDKRGTILAALREIFDGQWSRRIGGEGGSTLEWSGKLGVVMCSTTAYDRAHEVIAELGDRFVLIRLADDDPEAGMLAGLTGAGGETRARAALADAVAGLLGHDPASGALEPDQGDRERLAMLANFVTLARSPVARDFRGEIELVHDREGPYRFGKQLYALWRGCGLLGLDAPAAWQVAARVARDSLPKLRWKVIAALAEHGELTTSQVCAAVWHPSRTTRRTLEDLTAHRVVTRQTVPPSGDRWQLAARPLEAAREIAGRMPVVSPPLTLGTGTAAGDAQGDLLTEATDP